MVGSKHGPSGVAGLVAKPHQDTWSFSAVAKPCFCARFETLFMCDLPQEPIWSVIQAAFDISK